MGSKRKIMKKGITLILILFWLTLIFSFSAQNGGKSGGTSRKVAYWIAETGNRLFHMEKSEEELYQQAESMQFVIRKGAHMSEYAILAVLVLLHLLCYEKRPRHLLLTAWMICVLFAAADEFHQLFVPGRSGQLKDVCIDAAGSLIGGGVFLGIRSFFGLIKKSDN